jgi:hypothetical protein
MFPDQDQPTLVGISRLAFPDVGGLLWRPDLWGAWLEEHPGEGNLLKAAHSRLVRLTSHTGWPEEQVLERLGCSAATDEELYQLATERLGQCRAYFEWVETLLRELDIAADKRLAVSGAARLFANAGKDVLRCEEVMQKGSFAPLEYLKLGEIARSWQTAIRELPLPRSDRPRATAALNPFVDERAPHLSPKRLDLLNEEDARSLLGTRVRDRMRDHLKYCPTCKDAYEQRTSTARRRAEGLRVHELIAASV